MPTFDCPGPQESVLSGEIAGSGSVSKTGFGFLHILSTNSYSGRTFVEEGAVLFRHNLGLGASAFGTIVSEHAFLFYNGAVANEILTEPVVLSGTLLLGPHRSAVWNAPLIIQSNATVHIRSENSSELSFPAGIAGAGSLLLDNTAFPGETAARVKFPAHNTFSGGLICEGLELNVSGSLSNASLTLGSSDSGATRLSGTGLVRALTAGAGTTISPAGEDAGDGTASTLTVMQSLTMQGNSRLLVHLNGLNVQDYDQVDVRGTVRLGLGNAVLEVRLGFVPPEGHVFAILDNDGTDGILGNFLGKNEGDIFTANGVRLRISYAGITGNDISLTVLGPEELTWTGLASNGNWSSPANWSPVRAPRDGDRLLFPGGTPQRLMTNTLAGLDLHSLSFSGVGANNNRFFVRGLGLTLAKGIVVTNPASVEFQVPVSLGAPQSLIARGDIAFAEPLTLKGDLTVTGDGGLHVQTLLGTGGLQVNGVNTELSGTNTLSGGVAISNARLNYEAEQISGPPVRLTNSTLRLNANHATVRGLLLVNSVLDLATANTGSTAIQLHCAGDLEFQGVGRLEFIFDPGKQGGIDVAGRVLLGSSTLLLSNISSAFGTPITLIANRGESPTVGTFKLLPEGSEIVTVNGTRVALSYRGGDRGRDVTLTPIAPITGVTRVWRGAGLTANWNESANWLGGVIPSSGDSLEVPDAPRAFSTNNLPFNRVDRLRFTGSAGLKREVTSTGPLLGLLGGIDYRDTGRLRFPASATGLFSVAGVVQAQAAQSFFVASGGHVQVDALTGLPGALVTKTGGGDLEIGFNGAFFGLLGAPLRQAEGLLRVLEADAPIEQIGGTLEIGVTAKSVNLFGGAFQTASILTNKGVKLGYLDAGRATNPVIIRPGGENFLGRITAENGITLNSNVTLRLDIASISIPGLILSNHDFMDLADTGEMRINDARLELNFLPEFRASPISPLILVLSRNAVTNIGNFSGLPHHALLTNEVGVFQISYRDFIFPPPFNLFLNGPQQGLIVLERTIARPLMLAVTEGPGTFSTIQALGTPDVLYVIEGSEDLEHWTALGAGKASPGTGVVSFVDVTPMNHRFYRASLP